MTETPLWQPSDVQAATSNMGRFMTEAAQRWNIELPDYAALHTWSVEHREDFWSTVWDFCGVRAAGRGSTVLRNGDAMPGAEWFPEAQLNFAENLLRGEGSEPAIMTWPA